MAGKRKGNVAHKEVHAKNKTFSINKNNSYLLDFDEDDFGYEDLESLISEEYVPQKGKRRFKSSEYEDGAGEGYY